MHDRGSTSFDRLTVLRDAVSAICDGNWDDAENALAHDPALIRNDAVRLNLLGIVFQARGQWRRARRFYGKAMRADRSYLPAEQNMRRLYELDTFGATNLPIALADRAMMLQVRQLSGKEPDDEPILGRISLWISADATMGAVTRT